MHIHQSRFLPSLAAFALLSLLPLAAAAKEKNDRKDDGQVQAEESQDYFRKWLTEDVIYIITEDEKAVFDGLTNEAEKEQFIEQFWYRRDLDLRTPINEFKEEHYRRIAYANERFHSGKSGWRSDRGRIYIIHGPPDEIEDYGGGGQYVRESYEGGGTTTVHPFERWRYRKIDGLGSDITLEFVDESRTGEYRLALHPDEKDALIGLPGLGLTDSERLGLTQKGRRLHPDEMHNPYLRANMRRQDHPFTRFEIFAKTQAARPIKYNDLRDLVKVTVNYTNLPFQVRSDYFRLNQDKVLIPVTVELQNRDMTFKQKGASHYAQIGLYGAVTNMGKKFIQEFDQDMTVAYPDKWIELGRQSRSLYQKVLLLDNNTRYKLDLIVKDLNSDNVGAVRHALIPPPSVKESQKLSASSLVLSDHMRELEELPEGDEMFVFGDVKLRPSIARKFTRKIPLGIYLHLYNFKVDQTSNTPLLEVSYRIRNGNGQLVRDVTDSAGESIRFLSEERVVLTKKLDLSDLEPGTYLAQVEARDSSSDERVQLEDRFRVVGN